ncbi:tetratricopeptide repeat protein [Lutibacter sp. Hel_I_33_5]|uniref:tetratricopeptide repeat protein n=1 Tax=Lutibacter sp. Hel_I_33_5 TaxID=1566289 RepID=UPI00119F4368|nr:tetratricopeptide repeat protein [Lutibacter sp. Hel_I_33_5]TVZ55664.1 tetratricopeptide repeat protein [Lutibacter sp. Hel_I_33_5]
MKKQILALSLGLMTIGAFAQKNELKAASKALKKSDFSTALAAINSAEGLIGNMDAKQKALFYFTKGQVFAGKKDFKMAAEAFNMLMKHEKETGKAKYTAKAKPLLNKLVDDSSTKAANLYSKDKNYKAASESFYLTYLLSPKDTSHLYNAAISASQAEEYEASLKYFSELKKINYKGIVKEYLATNKETGKVENLGSKPQRDLMVKSGSYTNPENKTSESKQATIVKQIGLVYIKLGKTEEAIAAVQEARKSDPKDLDLLLTEADLYIKLKRMDKFGELMKEATELDPTNPTLFYNLGVVSMNQKRVDDAKKYYKKAIELKPDYRDAYMNLAVAVLDKEKSIIEEMNNNLDNFKKYDALELEQKAVHKEAIPYLEKADELERDIDTVRTLLNLYDTLEMEEKADKFRALYKSMKTN